MVLFASTIFLSAFLLFLVQPVIAKQILPWFGGSAAVWTTCMVFFQLALLAGYAYSDFVVRRLSARQQAILHTALILVSLAFLPITPSEAWKPEPDTNPGLRIFVLLALTIGLPYFLLSTTGPLVQAWFARRFPAGTVYRLFALSNFASLLSLLAYPPAIEPNLTLKAQSWSWSALYLVFAALCIVSAWKAAAHAKQGQEHGLAQDAPVNAEAGPPPAAADYLLWFSLSALGSVLLISFTNHITQNVASVPFLWIVPLVLYLLTFILVFDVGGGRSKSGWYSRLVFLPPLFGLLVAMAYGLADGYGYLNIKVAIPLFCAGLFVACMFCHGEMAAMRPAPAYLTRFYLMLSVGGAAGGLFVGLVAPLVFNTFLELPLGLAALGLLAAFLTWRTAEKRGGLTWGVPVLAFAAFVVSTHYLITYARDQRDEALLLTRNFYGTLRVKQNGPDHDPATERRLVHGVINHGSQLVDPSLRNTPISYFGPSSGIARALDFYGEGPRKVGIVGLGVGVFVAWSRPGDSFRIYELDPAVVEIAQEWFWYLKDSRAKIEIVTGDGRLNLERDPPQHFDLLSIDAFSSGSIPMHLITREALRAYKRHLKPGGAIVYNVTNRFINLAPVVKMIAEAEGMQAILIEDSPGREHMNYTAYVIVTANPKLLADARFAERAEIDTLPRLRMWTDDFNNLFDVLR